MRAYPLEIREMVSPDEELQGVYSKGHHGDAFIEAARKHLLERQGWDEGELDELLEAIGPAFETWRCVPTLVMDGEWWVSFHKARPGSRGSFPVTVLRTDG